MIREWIKRGWLEERYGSIGLLGDSIHDTGVSTVAENGAYIGLTKEGLGLSDYIGPQLISEEIRNKMLEWERINA